jgi:3-oxoacyl-[acyl-carrier protein] reductase
MRSVERPLQGRRALVTGGTRGIGRATAIRLAADGATVTVTGTGNNEAPAGCDLRAVNFADRRAMEAFAADVRAWGLDILVNNAGINRIAPFADILPEDFDRIHQVNVRAPFLLCQAVVPGMRRLKWGRIVNITSIFGIVGKELRGSYASSKFALDGMTAALAAEVGADGILANCVAPGVIDTELTRRVLGEAGLAELLTRVPMRRLGAAEEIAAFVAWLVGPENTFISGQNIAIDGGFTRI